MARMFNRTARRKERTRFARAPGKKPRRHGRFPKGLRIAGLLTILAVIIGGSLFVLSRFDSDELQAPGDGAISDNSSLTNGSPSSASVDTGPRPSTDPADRVNQANKLLADGKVSQAIRLYQKEVKANPNDENSHFNLAAAYARNNQYDKAKKHYQKALEIWPDYAEAYNNLGNLYLKQGRSDKAIDQFQKALEIYPEYAYAYNNLGKVYAKRGNYMDAIANFSRALEIKPNYLEARYNLATAYFKQKRHEEAVRELKRVLRMRPGFKPAIARLREIQRSVTASQASQ